MLETALSGVRVIDLSRILAGPWCTQNLADLGARVLKIEHPERGDDTRQWGPPYFERGAERMSAYFSCCNRGKTAIGIDFSSPEGAQKIRELAADADVFVENFRVGTLAKYRLDYQSLRAINPRLIYLSITGYGQSGPSAHKPGYDYVFQGTGGLMSYTGLADGEPGAMPLRTGVAVVDISTGLYATSAVLAALVQRQASGAGQHLDIALLDVAVALNANQGANYLASGVAPQRTGNAHPNCAPYEVFACADGHLILAIGNDTQFRQFCQVVGQPAWASDARFASNEGRLVNLPQLRALIRPILQARRRVDWTTAFDAQGVPWGPINTLADVFEDPQVKHRRMLQIVRHPTLGEIPTVRNPMLSAQDIDLRGGIAPPSAPQPFHPISKDENG